MTLGWSANWSSSITHGMVLLAFLLWRLRRPIGAREPVSVATFRMQIHKGGLFSCHSLSRVNAISHTTLESIPHDPTPSEANDNEALCAVLFLQGVIAH